MEGPLVERWGNFSYIFCLNGIVKQIAVAALEFAREKQLTVVPLCPFVAGYIKRHPDYIDLVREDHRGHLIRKSGEG